MKSAPAVVYSDIQGIVRFGYARLTEASFILLSIRDAAAARTWIKGAPITTAEELSQPPLTALQVAFTNEGLQALNVPAHVRVGFSAEFLTGMSGDVARSRRLGDVGANAPESWKWGGPGNVPHLLVMLYAQEGLLEGWTRTIEGGNWDAAFEIVSILPTSNLYGLEPFGFKDGVSQPLVDWEGKCDTQGDQLTYRNLTSLGEFLLGYPNEYGKYTDRPLLPPSEAYNSKLQPAANDPTLRDLGLNGTYLVFRQLEQDVRGFWLFVDKQSNSSDVTRQRLSASMIGRNRDGHPLLPISLAAIVGVEPKDAASNQFTYESDPQGACCPLGAHIRRANPRNGDLPSGTKGVFSRLLHTLGFGTKSFRDDVIASTRFHRLLRRGREYGPALTEKDALDVSVPDCGEHGIHFITINANISRQFEFVQSSWIMGTKFDGLTDESDPLLGNREPVPGCLSVDNFSIGSESGLGTRLPGLPQFITVHGGAYFFLPGLSAIRYITSIGS
jgi:deferrochelatase/peroxidase EfeB